MAKSTTKKRIGRPPTGQRPNALTRLDPKVIDAIDKLARQQGTTRSEIMRQLINEALAARKRS
jgi:predicted transcriptional regulator